MIEVFVEDGVLNIPIINRLETEVNDLTRELTQECLDLSLAQIENAEFEIGSQFDFKTTFTDSEAVGRASIPIKIISGKTSQFISEYSSSVSVRIPLVLSVAQDLSEAIQIDPDYIDADLLTDQPVLVSMNSINENEFFFELTDNFEGDSFMYRFGAKK